MSQANNDCYYYFYSNCTKVMQSWKTMGHLRKSLSLIRMCQTGVLVYLQGDSCPFRHEPHARGSEVMCEDWEFGKCLKKICPKRHMIITVCIHLLKYHTCQDDIQFYYCHRLFPSLRQQNFATHGCFLPLAKFGRRQLPLYIKILLL